MTPIGRLQWGEDSVQVEYDDTGALKLFGSPGCQFVQAFVDVSAAILVTEDGQKKDNSL